MTERDRNYILAMTICVVIAIGAFSYLTVGALQRPPAWPACYAPDLSRALVY
jgi:hypothetical protein